MFNLKYIYPIAIDMGEQSIYAAQLKETRQGLAVRGWSIENSRGLVPLIGITSSLHILGCFFN